MREKSKFITFILSFLPGLSHFYLGFPNRGLIFTIVFFMPIVLAAGLQIVFNSYGIYNFTMGLLFITLPLIWLVALLDAFSLIKKINSNGYTNDANQMSHRNEHEIKESNRKTITLALSIIPGAGHMYLGLQKKGLVLMAIFFFTIFFMGWLGLSLLLFILPLIWFYSFFDAFHTVNENDVDKEDVLSILPKIKSEWIGWGLIAIGILVIIERIIYPLIPYEVRNYIQTSVVSIIFILGGIKLLNKSKEHREEDEDTCKEDE